MTARNFTLRAALVAGLAVPASLAQACGGMAMMAPMSPMHGHSSMAVPVQALPTVGTTVEALPLGYVTVVVEGATYFRAGSAWYVPFQGPTGPVFRVVHAPHGMM
jgi:hypothetical protein